jgi:hypothetical protein
MMSSSNATSALAQGLSVLESSLPQYLANTRPWMRRGDEKAADVLEQIIREQRRDSVRIADVIEAANEPLPSCQYPMSYTDTHDLSMEYLVREMIAYQKQDIVAIEHCTQLAATNIAAKSLLEEVLGSSRAHLELLEELVGAAA